MPMPTTKTIAAFLLLSVFISHAQSQETPEALGPVYPVIEPDILAILQKHVAENREETQKRTVIAQDRFKALLQNPQGRTLTRATDLSVKKEPVSLKVTSVIDPTYRRDWLFIDGKESTDLALARYFIKEHPTPNGRVIAVAGSVDHLQKALQTRIWFDQQGRLIKRLQIEALPAWVTLTANAIEVKTGSSKALLPLMSQSKGNES